MFVSLVPGPLKRRAGSVADFDPVRSKSALIVASQSVVFSLAWRRQWRPKR